MKGKGWHGEPKRHSDAAKKTAREAQLKNTLRQPMAKGTDIFDPKLETGFEIWDKLLSSTGMPQKRTSRGELTTIVGRIVLMSPTEYFRQSFKTFGNYTDALVDELVEDVLERNVCLFNTIDTDKVTQYAEAMKNGARFPIPVIDRAWNYNSKDVF